MKGVVGTHDAFRVLRERKGLASARERDTTTVKNPRRFRFGALLFFAIAAITEEGGLVR